MPTMTGYYMSNCGLRIVNAVIYTYNKHLAIVLYF